jgi:small GTP-binding protein
MMQIWDTAGQAKYRSFGPIYYRNSAVGVAVFNLTATQSLPSPAAWISKFKMYTEAALLFIVGNKLDLVDDRQITEEEAQPFSKEQSGAYSFASAKTGNGMKDLFAKVFQEFCLPENRKRCVIKSTKPDFITVVFLSSLIGFACCDRQHECA